MDDEMVVEEGVSRFGLHRLHVARMGGKVDVERWVEEKVTSVGGEMKTWFMYEEEGIGVWHLRLWWKH